MIFRIDQLIKLYEMVVKKMENDISSSPQIATLLRSMKSYGSTINRADLETFCEYLWIRFPGLAYITGELLAQTKDQSTVFLSDKYIKALAALTVRHKKNAGQFEK